MPTGWPLLLGTLPLLGPGGWVHFGVAPSGRDVVAFDVRDCHLRVAHVDLDGGPEHHAVQVGRVWEGGWRTLGLEGLSRLTGAEAPARTGDGAAWIEARAGGDELRGVNQDGDEVRWRWEGDRLLGFTDAQGVRTTYGYGADGALSSLSWPDGSGVQLAPGRITGSFGSWSCVQRGPRVVVTDPGGAEWRVEPVGEEWVLTDPAGGSWRTRVVDGRLAGWTDARGTVVRLGRAPDGSVVEVTDGGDRWSLPAAGGGTLTGPGGLRWTLERDVRGLLVRLLDGVGRAVAVDHDAAGRVRNVWRGGTNRVIARDGAGRVVSEQLPGSLRVEATRDAHGRVATIADPSGATWRFTRDAGGRISAILDPVGGAWTLVRDRVGRVISVTDPRRVETRVERREDGRIGRIERAPGGRWELLRGVDGRLSAVKDPSGHRTGWTRDAVGRVTGVLRADGTVVPVQRDAVGEITAVGEVRVERDAAGRPRAARRDDGPEIRWAFDPAGRVRDIEAPGLGVRISRAADGAIDGVRPRVGDPWLLGRDGAGRVVAVDGPGAVRLRRDGGGRVIAVVWDEGGELKIDRDLRGLPARLREGEGDWRLRRDAVGRLLGASAGRGVELGVDRDGAGRPGVVRFGEGWLARYTYEGAVTTVHLQDGEGGTAGTVAWAQDAAGRLLRRTADADWVFRRDPVGILAAVESAVGAWSRSPDRVEGPGEFEARLTSAGRPLAVSAGTEGPPPYGLPARAAAYELGPEREVVAITAEGARVGLRYDGLGRLGAVGDQDLRRDALGGLRAVGETPLLGYDLLLRVGTEARAGLPGVGWARRGGGLVLDGAGLPILSVFLGPVGVGPTGRPSSAAAAETGAGGRFQMAAGGPLLGRLDALDPFTGQSLGPGWAWPWQAGAWEVLPGTAPWADADEATPALPWDPAVFAPRAPSALDLLVAAGELPGRPGAGSEPPGLPWLPASLAPTRPPGLVDPEWVVLDDDPLVELVWRRAHAPVRPLEPEDVVRALFAEELAAEMDVAPGLLPELPAGLLPDPGY